MRQVRIAGASWRGAATALALVPAVACSVGVGSGDVTGTLNVLECTFPEGNPAPLDAKFKFSPTFFVGQPVDADPRTAPRFPANQMLIRLQPVPQRIEDADALVFWVLDSAAVARCMRGAMPGGVPEWDPEVCDRSTGEGRMLVGMTSEKVSSFITLNHTCSKAQVLANALGACTDGSCPERALCPGRGSWVTFSDFGDVPDDESKPIAAGYKVSDNQYIGAKAFHLELCDTATVTAKLDNMLPIPKPNITGVLEGNFQFKLVRGQGAQPFP